MIIAKLGMSIELTQKTIRRKMNKINSQHY